MLTFFLICLAVGAFAGFLAGLFGIGGGLIIVPILVYLMPKYIGVPDSMLMACALGTSFATIVITGFSSAQRHHKLGNVVWDVVKILAPVIMISTFISGFFISYLPKDISAKLFACLVVYLSIKMFLSVKPNSVTKALTKTSTIIAGILIGMASSAAGIGGGGFIVPFLNSRGIDMKKAIGSSAVCGSLLAIAGMLSFMIAGWGAEGLPDYFVGYVYLPALLGITLTSVFTSKIGATVTTILPVPILKKAFAVLLLILAINMIFK
ncbi:MAG: sulfite exporter TauE/SafE family protein [Pasteurella oralis]|uniref:sulfite exporter TauE/SafE family protein n=1 Tax=Pasteurella oralis TaxID=1071947 RepID=UPI000C7C908D|nr:sulfite exporter TauE/SafE family protein [Pasteurella oralis]MDO5054989.1 sulfite exporter TauE/SafE family protein [Pasteurella oralis]